MMQYKKQFGYVTLLSVLVVGAVGVAVSLSLLLLGLGSSRTGFALQQMYQAKALADACAEDALLEIRNATSFTGNGSLTLGQGTCSYTVTSQGGQNRTVTATGMVGSVTRKVKGVLTKVSPNITVASWKEVGDF